MLGIVNAFDNPTRQAFVVEMVGPTQLQNAIALNSSLFNAARIIGPAVGGVVISTVGIGQAFLLNGLSFLPVLAGLFMMRPADFFVGKKAARENVFKQLGDGLRYAASTPETPFTLIAVGVLGTFGYNFSTILPLIAKYVLHGGADVLGSLTSAMGVGSLASALAVAGAKRASLTRLLGAGGELFRAADPGRPVTLVAGELGPAAGIGCDEHRVLGGGQYAAAAFHPRPFAGTVMSLYFLLVCRFDPDRRGGGRRACRALERASSIVLMGAICLAGVGVAAALARRSRLVGDPPPIMV